MDGSVFEKKYTFVIDSKGPDAVSMSVNDSGYKIGYSDLSLDKVLVNSSTVASVDANGVATVNKSSAKNDKLFITAYDTVGNVTKSILHTNDENNIMVSSNKFTSNYDFTSKVKDKNGLKEVTLTYMQTKTAEAKINNTTVIMPVPAGFDANSLEVYNYNTSGKRVKTTGAVIKDGTVKFTCNVGHFILVDTSVAKVEDADQEEVTPTPTPEKKGCGGSVAATSIILSATAVMGVVLLAIKKRKDD